MRVVADLLDHPIEEDGLVLTIGSFDGVHRGHQAILEEVVRTARENNGTAAVVTMRPHPRQFFTPDDPPNLLTAPGKKEALFEAAGVDLLIFLRFDAHIANLDRTSFVREILHERCRARHIVIGHDFCFGKDASGDYTFLDAIGPEYGFDVKRMPPLLVDGERASSTRIRELVLQGDLDRAARFLGRRYAITGQVVAGRGIGAKLGFPTANVRPFHNAVPAQGVYAAQALLADGTRHTAAVNIGIAPTIRQEDLTIEAHLLDFQGELSGQKIEVEFHHRLRPEQKFPSPEALIAQIGQDVEAVRTHFA
jgi:riboflavin kinase/FMN adenylyltransferase